MQNKGKGDEKEKKPVESEKEKNGGGSDKKKEGGVAEKKEEGPPKVVLKVDMHCEGCASKIKRCVKGFEGVEGVTLDMASNKLTVVGTADPWKLRDHVEVKTRKKVEIVSPANQPKKDTDGGKKPADGDKKPANGDKKPISARDTKDMKKPEDKKSKEAASTIVLKVRLHCDGCIQRIKKTIFKIKGVQDVSVDAQKDLVTVKGTMDVNSLPPCLKEKLNRGVEIVAVTTGGGGGGGNEKKDKPAAAASGGVGAGGGDKKEKVGVAGAGTGSGGGGGARGDGEKKGNGSGDGGEKKGNGGGGGGEKKSNGSGGGGEKKGNGGGGGGEKKGNGGGAGGGGVGKEELPEATVLATAMPVVEANKMDYYGGPYGHRAEMVHAPQLFSDENPNACSVM